MRYDSRKWTGNRRASQRRHPAIRWALGVGLLIAAGYAGTRIFLPAASDSLWGFEPTVLLPLILSIRLSPFGRDSWLTPRGLSVFDEWERDTLQRASSYSYAALLGLLLGGLIWLSCATRFHWPKPASWQQWGSLAMMLTGIGAALPVLLAEWMIPLPPKGDEDEVAA